MIRRLAPALVVVLAIGPVSAVHGAPSPQADRSNAGSYIVVLRDSVSDPRAVAAEHSRAQGAQTEHVYSHALKGYSARMSATAAANISRDQRVAYVEPDGEVWATAIQTGATWGLDRIDQTSGLDGSYTYNATGSGVTAFILDTGIRLTHSEFAGRLVGGFDAVTSGGNANDCNGHGTHVAGTVGGTTYGVAKAVKLSPVRVLGCNGSGSWSGVIAGIDWVTSNPARPAVANMSLTGGGSAAVDSAVKNSIASGVTYSLAAGNGNQAGVGQDACNYSPARVPEGLTVGATNSSDTKAGWSNFGTCLDLFAPGVSITSAWYSSDTTTNTISGTSMAAPHVAGVAALYLEGAPSATPATVASAISSSATPNKVGSAGTGSPNLLLYSLLTPSETAPPPPAEEPPPPTTISLDVSKSGKSKGMTTITLTWAGSSSTDVIRNGTRIASAVGGTTYQDPIKGGGTWTYQVCASGGSACSAPKSITT